MWKTHKYQREIQRSRILVQQNKNVSSRLKQVRHANVAFRQAVTPGRPGQTSKQAGQQGRLAMLIDVPSLTANIFVSAAKRTNIDNKTGGVCI
jgi:hypothetical protein